MELCKEFKSLSLNESREKIKESFELDYQENLPQYLDDIERIIKCSVNSTVTDYDFRNSTVTIYGKSIISITYKSANSCILSNIFEEDFSKSFEFNNCDSVSFAKIKLRSKYNNVHMINQRRIDVHTALVVCIEAFCNNSTECLSSCENAFFKDYTADYLSCKNSGIVSADFDENITVIDNDTQIKSIINCSATCRVDDRKIIKDKMLIKGTVNVCFVYECINGAVEKTSSSFIFSKIVEASNLDENDVAFINASLSNTYVKAKADENNCLRIIEFAGKISLEYQIYRIENLSLNIDTYVPHCKISSNDKVLNIKSNPVFYSDNKTIEFSIDCDNTPVEIIDFRANIIDSDVIDSVIKLNIGLSLIYYDDKSNICYFECEKEADVTLSDTKLSGTCMASMLSYDYVLKGDNKVSVRANIDYMAYLYDDNNIRYLTDIDISEELSCVNSPQLSLYFADKNEEIWEIAKKFSTSSMMIMEENNLTADIIDTKRILLIPGM